jgi:hypothetical protein
MRIIAETSRDHAIYQAHSSTRPEIRDCPVARSDSRAMRSQSVAHGLGRPTRGLFGPRGRVVLERLPLPEPWHGTLCASLVLIESPDEQISEIERQLRALGADHPYAPLLKTVPGIAWILA